MFSLVGKKPQVQITDTQPPIPTFTDLCDLTMFRGPKSKKLPALFRTVSQPFIKRVARCRGAVAEPVRLVFLWRPAVRDPEDDMVLEAAVNGRADAIVTFNLRDFGKVAERFGIMVLSPGEALRQLERKT
ncbi:PIN domain-containing protein [Mesorhizobium sp. M00.F.Ca.ET.216.01.1.1]|uniref:PIN domain-containing protein n=1 Tax=Mesorhizobium sp. M00.F.Ca.ET.216.01.1.1 TaxID=2500528 RepID=UPI001FE1689D|nr:PIN domain-containing protein [Mesorhizobium sp. M00.F.Ca.ET.216.01.1.1]